MAKYCKQCGKKMPDEDFTFCPWCTGELEERIESGASFNLSLGDANAVEGGIHLSDSHAVDSHNVHNETHNVTHNTWVTQQERQLTPEEIRESREKEFRNIVRDVFEDGRITGAEREMIERKEKELGIDRLIAIQIFEQEKEFSLRRIKDRALDEDEYNLIKITQSCIRSNDRDGLAELFDDLRRLNARIDNGQVQFFYYMLFAALQPQEFIKAAEEQKVSVDSFWRTFWLSMAYRMTGTRKPILLDNKFRMYVSGKDKQFPGNAELALSLDNLKESLVTRTAFKADICRDTAKKKIELFESDHQSYLNELGNAVKAVLSEETYPLESKFYIECFFPEVINKFSSRQEQKRIEEEIFLPLTDIPTMPKIDLLPE
jgi:rRNA maturation endonuclease Nob1